jgi:hypothetical protein
VKGVSTVPGWSATTTASFRFRPISIAAPRTIWFAAALDAR